MKLCPSCGNSYGDDARFCPMDATLLPAPAAAGPGTSIDETIPDERPVFDKTLTEDAYLAPRENAVPTDITQAPVIAGRFVLEPEFIDTPTGRLHLAADLQASAQVVMVKLVPQEAFPSPMLLDRALRELRQLGRVSSRRVMHPVASGRTTEGELYVAFTPPPPTAEMLDELVGRVGALPPDRARAITLQIGEALIEAHQVGVVHRNLAPHAVYVSPGDNVLVVDFALAEVSDWKGRMVQGAPHYLSPEQAEGKSIDQRSSVYNLAAVYYYLLTGAPPFLGTSVGEVLGQVLSASPPPPSARRPGLTAAVDHAVLKALDKASARRHLTLRQLVNELEEIGSVLAPPPPQPAQPYRPASRTLVMETALHADTYQDEVRFPQTLLGVSPVAPPTGSAPAVTPAALGAAFSTQARAQGAGALDAPDLGEEGATVPMPRMSEEEMAATFGLELPPRRSTVPPGSATAAAALAADPPRRSTLPPGSAAAADLHHLSTEPGLPLSQRPTMVIPADARGSLTATATAAAAAAEPAPSPWDATVPDTASHRPPTQQLQATPVAAHSAPAAGGYSDEIAPPPEPLINPALLPQGEGAESQADPGIRVQPSREHRPPAFRETAWFKRGEIVGTAGEPGQSEESAEIVVSPEDHARLSLRKSGDPSMKTGARAAAQKALPGEQMSDAEVIAEMRGKSRMVSLFLVSVGLGLLAGLIYVLLKP